MHRMIGSPLADQPQGIDNVVLGRLPALGRAGELEANFRQPRVAHGNDAAVTMDLQLARKQVELDEPLAIDQPLFEFDIEARDARQASEMPGRISGRRDRPRRLIAELA